MNIYDLAASAPPRLDGKKRLFFLADRAYKPSELETILKQASDRSQDAEAAIEKDALGRVSWRVKWAEAFEWVANRISQKEPPDTYKGKLLTFEQTGSNLGYPVYRVVSTRGGFTMGRMEWSNQWRRPRFMADPEAVFDPQCLAELYTMCKQFR